MTERFHPRLRARPKGDRKALWKPSPAPSGRLPSPLKGEMSPAGDREVSSGRRLLCCSKPCLSLPPLSLRSDASPVQRLAQPRLRPAWPRFAPPCHRHAGHIKAVASPAVSALRFAVSKPCLALPPHSLRTDAIASIVFPCLCLAVRCSAVASLLSAVPKPSVYSLCFAYAVIRSAPPTQRIAFPCQGCAGRRIAHAVHFPDLRLLVCA